MERQLVEIIETHFTFHSEMHYVEKDYRFELEPLELKAGGIYAIIDQFKKIQKIGKADGAKGIGGRVENYRRNNFDRHNSDATVKLWRTIMTKDLKDAPLHFYYFITPEETRDDHLLGDKIKLISTISYEKNFRRKAREEGHPLLLGKR